MIRAPKLVVSRPMYAFDPTTWREFHPGMFDVDAVWFGRKKGRLVAKMGTYHPFVYGHGLVPPADGSYRSWIEAANDNRYGGEHLATWDGEALLCTPPRVTPEEAARRIELLSTMLSGHPRAPAGYDGWWTFQKMAMDNRAALAVARAYSESK